MMTPSVIVGIAAGNPSAAKIVCTPAPGMLKWISSMTPTLGEEFAAKMAAESEPGPLASVLMTVKTVGASLSSNRCSIGRNRCGREILLVTRRRSQFDRFIKPPLVRFVGFTHWSDGRPDELLLVGRGRILLGPRAAVRYNQNSCPRRAKRALGTAPWPVRTLLGGENSPAAFRSAIRYRLTASFVRRASGATPSPGLSCPSRHRVARVVVAPRSRGAWTPGWSLRAV